MFGGPRGGMPANTKGAYDASRIPASKLPRSAFDLSYGHKTTCHASMLLPIYLEEILPGDTFNVNTTIFARLSTPLVPAMDNLEVTTQYFFVPNRLVWSNWEKFCGAQTNPGDSISYTIPQMGPSFTVGVLSLVDFFGIHTAAAGQSLGGTASFCNALPFRAYTKIWNDWYRDENIQNSITLPIDDGPDDINDHVLQLRGKKKDYFYGSLTSPQKGTAVGFLSGTANVYGVAATPLKLKSLTGLGNADLFYEDSAPDHLTVTGTSGTWSNDSSVGIPLKSDAVATGLIEDLSTDTIDVINTFRQAIQIQAFLEKDARGGTRYTELNLSHFGVTNPDSRLQRSEYLGGGTADLSLTPIPQTSPTGIVGTTTKLGDLSAFGTALSPRNGFIKSFTEHGYVLGLLSIRVKNETYQQGLERMWVRQTRYDFYWPMFAHLGEQAVLNHEIYAIGDKAGAGTDQAIWGYQERYAEYRSRNSMVTGVFKSSATSTLDYWHYATLYASRPSLNSTFIGDNSTYAIDRNLAITHSGTAPQFKVDAFHKVHAARVMPVYGTPFNFSRF